MSLYLPGRHYQAGTAVCSVSDCLLVHIGNKGPCCMLPLQLPQYKCTFSVYTISCGCCRPGQFHNIQPGMLQAPQGSSMSQIGVESG